MAGFERGGPKGSASDQQHEERNWREEIEEGIRTMVESVRGHTIHSSSAIVLFHHAQ